MFHIQETFSTERHGTWNMMDVLPLGAQTWVIQLLYVLEENWLWQPFLLKMEGNGINVQHILIYNTQSHPTTLKSLHFQKRRNFSICMKGGGMRDKSNSPWWEAVLPETKRHLYWMLQLAAAALLQLCVQSSDCYVQSTAETLAWLRLGRPEEDVIAKRPISFLNLFRLRAVQWRF